MLGPETMKHSFKIMYLIMFYVHSVLTVVSREVPHGHKSENCFAKCHSPTQRLILTLSHIVHLQLHPIRTAHYRLEIGNSMRASFWVSGTCEITMSKSLYIFECKILDILVVSRLGP